MTELEKQLSAALNKLEAHYNKLAEQSRVEREKFRTGLDRLMQNYESALDGLETELKREREATQKALNLSSKIVTNHQSQQQQISALSAQIEALATALPSLTRHCQTLNEALTSLQDQSTQIRAELEDSR